MKFELVAPVETREFCHTVCEFPADIEYEQKVIAVQMLNYALGEQTAVFLDNW